MGIFCEYWVYIALVIVLLLTFYIVFLKVRMAEAKRLQNKYIHDAYFHPVTNLPNKTNIELIFDEQIDRTLRHNQSFTVLAIKLNNYQELKETSEETANKYLYEASNLIIATTRDEDLAAHIEDDVFIILFNEYLEGKNFHVVLERLQKNFSEVQENGVGVAYNVSMGISVYPNDGTDSEVLIQKAISEAESKQF